jgi:hypothetical protein
MRTYGAIALSVALISSTGAQTNESSANYNLPGCRDYMAMRDNTPLERVMVREPDRLFRAVLCGGSCRTASLTHHRTKNTPLFARKGPNAFEVDFEFLYLSQYADFDPTEHHRQVIEVRPANDGIGQE